MSAASSGYNPFKDWKVYCFMAVFLLFVIWGATHYYEEKIMFWSGVGLLVVVGTLLYIEAKGKFK